MAEDRKENGRPKQAHNASAGASGASDPSLAAMRPPRPAKCRQFALARMAEAMPQLVGTLVERSAEGSLGHLKLLVQLSGLDEAEPLRRKRGKGLAQALAEEWRAGEEQT